jgi:hypothetical protein
VLNERIDRLLVPIKPKGSKRCISTLKWKVGHCGKIVVEIGYA